VFTNANKSIKAVLHHSLLLLVNPPSPESSKIILMIWHTNNAEFYSQRATTCLFFEDELPRVAKAVIANPGRVKLCKA
jgi:hypothetical protein